MHVISPTLLAAASLAVLAGTSRAQPESNGWRKGYVFAAVGNSSYNVYTNNGTFVETITSGLRSRNTAGGAFDSKFNLWTTEFQVNRIIGYGFAHPHRVFKSIAAPVGSHPESIVFDAKGNFYVGHADGDRAIRKYDATGRLLDTFRPLRESRGTDWIDLAADQRTIWYTSEGRRIKRYDVVARRQLPDFAVVPGPRRPYYLYALRLLPPFDGSGGLIVADAVNVKRLDRNGRVIQTYDAPREDHWFAMNLDPNGTSFWSGGLFTRKLYRFNIATGKVEVGPILTATSGELGGVIVLGEITGGNTPPKFDPPTPCNATRTVAVGSPLTFTVKASDVNAGDTVTLTATGVPAGATFTPSLPARGNPVTSVFRWTPTKAQLGLHTLKLTAVDRGGLKTTCSTTILVNACAGKASWSNYGTGWRGTRGIPALTLSGAPSACKPVTLHLDNSFGRATPACIVATSASAARRTIWGGTLLVDIGRPDMVPFEFQLPAGGLNLSLRVPCELPKICGIKVYMQAFTFDRGATQGVSFSRGLQMTVGN